MSFQYLPFRGRLNKVDSLSSRNNAGLQDIKPHQQQIVYETKHAEHLSRTTFFPRRVGASGPPRSQMLAWAAAAVVIYVPVFNWVLSQQTGSSEH